MATICTDAAYRPPGFSWPVRMLIGLAVTAALVAVAYFFVDQPVMSFFGGYGLNRYGSLKWLTRPPEAFVVFSPFVLLAGLLKRWFSPWTRLEKVAVAAAVSTLATALAALLLKMSFGRSSDGFHPFHVGPAFWAFPSGHTACTVSATAVAQVAFPRWRLLWWSVPCLVAATLIALNHHFVGDIFGGAFVGWAIGTTTARLFQLETSSNAEIVNGPLRPSSGNDALFRYGAASLRLFVGAGFLCLGYVCAGSDPRPVDFRPGIDEAMAMSTIKKGMTKDEVRSLLGRPHSPRDDSESGDEWTYRCDFAGGSSFRVHFGLDDRVTSTEAWSN